ncbi:tetratricopeptide repeat protein [Glycomyces sp. TRM65418]|uniref:tetratricopeptide repeat protein n=1 Tax=Glycomyces sp. TRM65418 TaxID=2867006 RepID=UPI001CE509BD|nr:tetratricopeptide repeat protein [Glycomyces sp. TRM65418]MCC3762950.1 tetratricopeptide repeat protein [Glycomyces sp. TRM65418]QZD56973.1 tetratricopeptide repeat protein [Glycomyces sp. TRM65418]
MADLAAAVDAGWAAADAERPEATIAYFRELRDAHPESARAIFEYAGSLDFAGREAEAAPVYEAAFAAGLDGDLLRQGLIQYGSTLRNIGRHDAAVATLREAVERFDGDDAARAFLALALVDADRPREAVATLLELALDGGESANLRQYARPLRAYARDLVEEREPAAER